MPASKRLIFDRTFSLPRGLASGRIKIFRAGPERDIFVSLELGLAAWETPPRKHGAAPIRA